MFNASPGAREMSSRMQTSAVVMPEIPTKGCGDGARRNHHVSG